MKNKLSAESDYSKAAIAIVLLIAIIIYWLNPFDNVISWDVFGYYLYLPATFIYNDIGGKDISWLQMIVEKYHNTSNLCQISTAENGSFVMVYSMGLAILNAPAFLIAHLFALISPYPADGFSKPYQVAINISAHVYTLSGLIFLRKILLRYFKDIIVAIVIIILGLGSNYFHNIVYGSTMPHNYLFALIAWFLWSFLKWEQSRRLLYIILMGVSGGLIILTRPNEIVVYLIPLLFSLYSKESLKQRWQIIKKYKYHVLLLALVSFVMILPQMIYWKISSGSWVYYSYPNGVLFDFSNPFLFDVVFGFRKGWLVYTPLMSLSFIGFIFVWKQNKPLFFSTLIYVLINIYIVASWSCWWYGGGDFSQRALVSMYAVLALPLAYFVKFGVAHKRIFLFIPVFLLLITLNLFQTWQFYHAIIDGERMTVDYYWRTFGKTTRNPENDKYLMVNRALFPLGKEITTEHLSGRTVYYNNFEHATEKDREYYSREHARSGSQSFMLDSVIKFSPALQAPFNRLTTEDVVFIEASIEIYISEDYAGEEPLLLLNCEHKGESFAYFDQGLKIESAKKNAWNTLKLKLLSPEMIRPDDKITMAVWHRGNQKIFVDDFKVRIYKTVAD